MYIKKENGTKHLEERPLSLCRLMSLVTQYIYYTSQGRHSLMSVAFFNYNVCQTPSYSTNYKPIEIHFKAT